MTFLPEGYKAPPEPITVNNYLSRSRNGTQSPQYAANPTSALSNSPRDGKLFSQKNIKPTQTAKASDLQDYSKVYKAEKNKRMIRINHYAKPQFPRYIPK